jgi:hypothetical protein
MHRVADVAAHVCAGSEVSVDVAEQTVTTMADAHLIQPVRFDPQHFPGLLFSPFALRPRSSTTSWTARTPR